MIDDTIMISIFLALEGVHAYSAFLPSIFTIETFVKTENGKARVREGELMASVFLAALAVVTSYLTKSKWPAIMALASGAAMVGVYEYALAQAPVSTGDMETDDTPSYRREDHDGTYTHKDIYGIER